MTGIEEQPWWHPTKADRGWDEPLPEIIELKPDYGAELPLWGAWLSPPLLDRLAAWQQDFDANFNSETGWRSAELRNRWARQADSLAAEVQTELGARAKLVVDLWPLRD